MLDLIHAGRGNRAGHGYQRRARIARGSELAEPTRTVAGDERQMGERLDVLHQRGTSAHPPLERERGREGRLGQTAVQRGHQRGLLPAHIARLELEKLEARIAVEPGRPVAQRRFQASHAAFIVLGRDEDCVAGTHRSRGHRGAVENQVRQLAQERTVLLARGLSLRAVGHHDSLAAARRHRAHLAGHRKRGAAVAAQPGALDERHDLFGGPAPQIRQGPVHVQVLLEHHHPPLADPGQQPR